MTNSLPSIKDLLDRRAGRAPTPSPFLDQTQTPPPAPSPAPAATPEPTTTPESPTAKSSPSLSQTIAALKAAKQALTPPKIQLADEETAQKFTEKMTEISLKEREEESARKAASIGVPSINLKGFPISPEALILVSEEQAKEMQVICFLYTGSELRLGALHPEDPAVQELLIELSERQGANPRLYALSEESFNQGLKLYAALPKIRPLVKGVQITEEELNKYMAQMSDMATIAEVMRRSSVTDILAVVIAASLKIGSSDIHIEAEEKGVIVRFRVDGILQEISMLAREQWNKIINRIKLIASLKINITDQAQDGRFTIFQQNKEIDVRISTIPTAFGESVVMRLLNPETIALEFEKLGFRPASLKRLAREIERPNGMIITTGPTGSGKTTTLYAILNKLNTSDVKIITLEDPVEYKVKGINQSQIDYSKDYTFAKGLRSILRQDPDIVMVGEIRDLETAEIAIQASLTGHLLLSTIHTNDAAGAVPRFLSMGVKPHLLAPALNGIMGQRLVRRLCTCKQPITLESELFTAVKNQLSNIAESSGESKVDATTVTFYGPKGCDKCHNSGYKGRLGVYEIMVKDAVVEQAILKGSISEYEMRDIAKAQGMVTMAQDGLLKASEGLTSVDEVKRIVGF
jgi:type II secretory ATPase GspE/PulE/Tfp pilus assembly ATPase PilB-like protein